jgi:hypothetical protein
LQDEDRFCFLQLQLFQQNGNFVYHLLEHEIIHLATQCSCVFRMVLTTNSESFPNSINRLGSVVQT